MYSNSPIRPDMIELSNISKQFGTLRVLSNLSIRFERRKTTAIIGPSGCGKSTLVRIVNGLVVPDHGNVTIDGVVLTPASVLELRRRIGYVIQGGGLFPHLTAEQNVTLMARHLGRRPSWISMRLEELVELVHLEPDRLAQYPLQLSGGQNQRVSLMRALFLNPDVLLFDEPLTALDPMIRADLQEELRTVFRTLGKTVLFVTHDLPEAGYVADDIVLIRSGNVVQRGSLEQLVDEPTTSFVTDFVHAQRVPSALAGRA